MSKLILWPVFLALFFYVGMHTEDIFNSTIFYIFQARDLQRALMILQGKIFFFGPEMSGGGNLPGPLYTYLLALAALFDSSWISGWWMQYILTFIAAVFGFVYFFKRSGIVAALCWFALFSLSPSNTLFLVMLLNVSCLILFVVSSLIGIDYVFSSADSEKRKKAFLVTCFVIGLGLQFHFSIIVFFMSLYFVHFFSKNFGLPKLPEHTGRLGLVAFIIPSVPYLIWLAASHFGYSLGENAFYAGEASKAPLNILQMADLNFSSMNKEMLFISIKRFFFTVPFVLFFLSPFLFKKRYLPFLVVLLFSLFPYLHWYVSPQAVRYTMPFYITLIFLAASAVDDLGKSGKWKIVTMIFGAVTFALVLWLMTAQKQIYSQKDLLHFGAMVVLALSVILIFKKQTGVNNSFIVLLVFTGLFVTTTHLQGQMNRQGYFAEKKTGRFLPNTSEWSHIWSIIVSETGWTYELAKDRVYYINHHMEQDAELFLTGFKLEEAKIKRTLNPDGFLVSMRFQRGRLAPNQFRKWLIRQPLQRELKEAILNEEVQLGQNLSDKYLVVPYWVKDTKRIPQHMHNRGQGYRLSHDDLQLRQIPELSGVKKLKKDQLLFKWNECPQAHDFCSTGAVVTINSEAVIVKVIGASLAQVSPWISPNWTQAWSYPWIKIKCAEKKDDQEFIIASSIGFRREYAIKSSNPMLHGNNSFVAPFEKDFKHNCKTVEKITLGRSGSQVELIHKSVQLPEKFIEAII